MERVDVCVLDDEPNVLRALSRVLTRELGLSVRTFERPSQALAFLQSTPVKVLVTDFRMPEMNGVEVLRAARAAVPETVRILLTGHADKEHIVEAINCGKIFRYVSKPWDNDALATLVAEAVATHDAAGRRHALQAAVDSVGTIQRALLKSDHLRASRADTACLYTPCEHASGDYVDVVPLPDGRTALAIGDVSGHGVGAAAFVFTARALIRSSLADGRDLPEVLERTNRFLCRDMEDGRFLTLMLAIHDADSGTISYVNAGHNSALLLDGGDLTRLDRTALPLGILDDSSYGQVAEVGLAAGATLLAYTDGVVEARGADGQLYGDDRLEEAFRAGVHLTPRALVASLDRRLREYGGAAATDDDVTLLVYRPVGIPVVAQSKSPRPNS